MARLSTHVLDVARGIPAAGVRVDLHRLGSTRMLMNSAVTNADGRTDQPLFSAEALDSGVYELTFYAGDYFRGCGAELAEPPFLNEIVIRFGVADPRGNYHVPLLLAPYGYSTYRGS